MSPERQAARYRDLQRASAEHALTVLGADAD